jgi:hypothetical protein
VLYAGHNVFFLHTPHQRRAHLPDSERFLSITFLTTSPARILRQVDTHSRKEVPAKSPHFAANGSADFLFKRDVKRRAPTHRHGEAGTLTHAAHYAARPVAEAHSWNPQPFVIAIGIGDVVVVLVGIRGHLSGFRRAERNFAAHEIHLFLKAHKGD